MATISGRLVYDANRIASYSASMAGISNVAIVLQNINTTATLAVLTNSSGNYSFINVPNGSYQLVESYGYTPASTTPADFNDATNQPLLSSGTVPPITFITNPPSDATNLDSTIRNTRLLTISNSNLADQHFLNGPVTYCPITDIMDNGVVISPDNLITSADNGTFGVYTCGVNANLGASPLPYNNLGTEFIYVLPNSASVTPNDGQFTIQNIMNNAYSNNVGTWWRVCDHTFGNEVGRMMVINGANPTWVIFKQTINVLPDTYYLFSSWILNLCKILGYAEPKLGVSIFNEFGEIMYSATLGELIPIKTSCPEWKQVGTVFYSASSTLVTIQFESMGIAATGNDYVMDDIAVNQITIPEFCPQKSVDKSHVKVGETVVYTITLENTGSYELGNVYFTDIVPDGLEFVDGSVKVNNVSMPLADPNLGFSVPNIQGETCLTVEFSAIAIFIPDENPTINCANITYHYTPVRGGIPMKYDKVSNQVPVQIYDDYADLEMIKTASPNPAIVGNYLYYTLTVKNLGICLAENVQIFDTLPGILLTPEFSTDNINWTAWQNPIDIGSLDVDETFQIFVRGIVANTSLTTVSNTATVVSTTFDPNYENNTSTVVSDIISPMSELADLDITKTATPNPCENGEELTFTLKITNFGPNNAEQCVLTDSITADITNPQFSFDNVIWQNWDSDYAIGTIIPGETITVYIKGTVNATTASTITNTAIIDSTTPDPNLENNTSTTITQISGRSLDDTITTLIYSIGLEELALSHILNAEGEKIQFVLAESANANVCDVLAINESVNKTLRSIVNTELLLGDKLEIAKTVEDE